MTRRILVAEDSPTQAEHLRLLLERQGYAVELVPDGAKGWERVQATAPDLIISDIIMPHMDGFAFCEAVKSSEATRQIPFVIVTVLNSPVDVVVGLEKGADNFLTKPFEDEYLLHRVERIFENLELHPLGLVNVGDRRIKVSANKEQIIELLLAIIHEMGQVNGQLVESRQLVEDYRQRLRTVEQIRDAVERDRFLLYCQPIVDLKQGRTASYEVLLRMLGPEGEVIAPGQFLGVAEQTGMIHHIDRWVVRRVIQFLAAQQRVGRPRGVSINLSGRSLIHKEIVPIIQAELQATGADPALLTFEVTETAVIAKMHEAVEVLHALKALGCRIALDDFGVGFSSFDYLKNLPLDFVKIDGSFIRDLPRKDVDQQLVPAMVQVIRALGMQSIAEFVGDAETLNLVRQYGADFGQGFHLGKPHPLDDHRTSAGSGP